MSILQFPPINCSHILPTSFCYWWKSSSFSCNCIFSLWNISPLWNINLSWLPCHTAFCGFLPTLFATWSHFVWLFFLYPLVNARDCYSSIWSYPLISCVTSFLGVPMHFLDFQFSSVQFSHSVVSNSLQPHGPQHARPPCPSSTQTMLRLNSRNL